MSSSECSLDDAASQSGASVHSAAIDVDVRQARQRALAGGAAPFREQLAALYASADSVAAGFASYQEKPLGVYDEGVLAQVLANEEEASGEFELHAQLEGDPCTDDTFVFMEFVKGAIALTREALDDLIEMFPMYAQSEQIERIVIERAEVEEFGRLRDQYYRYTIDRVIVEKYAEAQGISIDGEEAERARKLRLNVELFYLADVRRRLLVLDVEAMRRADASSGGALRKLVDHVKYVAGVLATIVTVAAELVCDQTRRLDLLEKHEKLEEHKLRVSEESLDHDQYRDAVAELAALREERTNTDFLRTEYQKELSEAVLYFDRKIAPCVADDWSPPDEYVEKAVEEAHERHKEKASRVDLERDMQVMQTRKEKNFDVPRNPLRDLF